MIQEMFIPRYWGGKKRTKNEMIEFATRELRQDYASAVLVEIHSRDAQFWVATYELGHRMFRLWPTYEYERRLLMSQPVPSHLLHRSFRDVERGEALTTGSN